MKNLGPLACIKVKFRKKKYITYEFEEDLGGKKKKRGI